jgi:TPR repeat protein
MKRSWQIVLGVAFIAVIIGTSLAWRRHRVRAAEWNKVSIAANEIRARAEKGDAAAECKLAWLYYTGKGVSRDHKEAIQRYQKAAEQGYAKAQFSLGDLYFQGDGVPKNYAEGARWIQKAADQGVAFTVQPACRLCDG